MKDAHNTEYAGIERIPTAQGQVDGAYLLMMLSRIIAIRGDASLAGTEIAYYYLQRWYDTLIDDSPVVAVQVQPVSGGKKPVSRWAIKEK
jgi:hypothetical protein